MKFILATIPILFYSAISYCQIADKLSLSSCFVTGFNDAKPISIGSGFFLNLGPETFFITNNHVIGGAFATEERLRLKGKPFPPDSIINQLQIRLYGKELNAYQWFTLPLNNSDKSKPILIWEDAINQKGLMDIVALPIPDSLKKYLGETTILSKTHTEPDLFIFPSAEIYIVGFPGEFGLNNLYPSMEKRRDRQRA